MDKGVLNGEKEAKGKDSFYCTFLFYNFKCHSRDLATQKAFTLIHTSVG